MGTGEQKPSILSLEDGQKLSRPNEEPTKPVINQKTKKTHTDLNTYSSKAQNLGVPLTLD